VKGMLEEYMEYLESIQIPIRLGAHTEIGWPVVISLWFLYENGRLLCATRSSARIISYLEKDERVGFEIAEDRPPYCGVRGQAKVLLDDGRGKEVLERLLVKYLGGTDNRLARSLLARADDETAIILEPHQVFSWNFSNRMDEVVPGLDPGDKCCP